MGDCEPSNIRLFEAGSAGVKLSSLSESSGTKNPPADLSFRDIAGLLGRGRLATGGEELWRYAIGDDADGILTLSREDGGRSSGSDLFEMAVLQPSALSQ